MDDTTRAARSQARGARAKAAPAGCLVSAADEARVTRGRAQLLPEDDYFELAETFRALADGSRIKIVYCLLRQELCTCDLAAITGSSESSVSQHLRVLRQLRLVKSRRVGKKVFYSLDDAHIRILLSVCLGHVRDAGRQHQGMDKVLALFEQAEWPGAARAPHRQGAVVTDGRNRMGAIDGRGR